jgi:methionine-rich copper-binding protein CopC
MKLSRLIAVTVLTVLVVSGAALAEGALHLRLTKSAPAKDTAVETAPGEIRLWFSLQPEVAVSRIKLTAADGSEIALGKVEAAEENALVAMVEGEMAPGSYEVSWRTSSGDGHPITGTFTFEVGATR